MSDERRERALAKLERLKAESTGGRWFWDDGWLLAEQGGWQTCFYWCNFDEGSPLHRGRSNTPGHEHLNALSVLYGRDHGGAEVGGSDADKELIVTLHRTLDVQLALLRLSDTPFVDALIDAILNEEDNE